MHRWRNLAGAGESPTKFVYRGVHANHPAFNDAREGTVTPGNVEGTVSAEEHNAGGVSDRSPFTSWTYRAEIAEFYARRTGQGGLVLRVPIEAPPAGASWSWEWSPDIFGESEILLRGIRREVEVLGHADLEKGTRRSVGDR
jgi:hypothetical protein